MNPQDETMKLCIRTLAPAALLLALLNPLTAAAGDGHDHGAPAQSAGGPALPRFTAQSELFELVGVVNDRQIKLYLDHAASNAPVKDAKLELEIGAEKLQAQPQGEGEFSVTLAQPLKPGVTPVTATVSTAQDSDLLAGEIDIHAAAPVAAPPEQGWQDTAKWVLGGLMALGLMMSLAGRLLARRQAQKRQEP